MRGTATERWATTARPVESMNPKSRMSMKIYKVSLLPPVLDGRS